MCVRGAVQFAESIEQKIRRRSGKRVEKIERRMRVAVVGAGVGGLAAVKCCRDEGLDVVCFERRNDLGGLWNYTETVEPGQSNVTRSEITTVTSCAGGRHNMPPSPAS